MRYKTNTPDEYVAQLPEERRSAVQKLRRTILDNLPVGFEEGINYGMIGYYVPHSIYPKGYHWAPELPLPFMNIASQKHSVNIYHSGMFADKGVYDWFVSQYSTYSKRRLDMGKSCIRFKKLDEIPYELIREPCTKFTVDEWIATYESKVVR